MNLNVEWIHHHNPGPALPGRLSALSIFHKNRFAWRFYMRLTAFSAVSGPGRTRHPRLKGKGAGTARLERLHRKEDRESPEEKGVGTVATIIIELFAIAMASAASKVSSLYIRT